MKKKIIAFDRIGLLELPYQEYKKIKNFDRIRELLRKELFNWAISEIKKYNVELRAISGEGNPSFWNEFEKELKELKQSKRFSHYHILGPVVAIPDKNNINQKNALVETFDKRNTYYWISPLRVEFHWISFTKFKNKKPVELRLYFESYHLPLSKESRYYIYKKLEKEDVEQVYDLLLSNFKAFIPGLKKISDKEALKEYFMEVSKIKKAADLLKDKFDIMTKEEIEKLLEENQ